MQFLLIGLDGTDENALERRLSARPAHMELAARLQEEGKLLMAAALLSEEGKMHGSTMIFQLETKEELDRYLEIEPYVLQAVWQKIEIQQVAVAPAFLPAQSSKSK